MDFSLDEERTRLIADMERRFSTGIATRAEAADVAGSVQLRELVAQGLGLEPTYQAFDWLSSTGLGMDSGVHPSGVFTMARG